MMDVMKTILGSCGELQISPKGRSMFPYLIEKWDKVKVLPYTEKLQKYDIVLYKSCGLYILHRVTGFDGEYYYICGDNTVGLERVHKDDIIGVVSEIIRMGGVVENKDSFRYHIWIKIWYKWNFKKLCMKLKKFLRNSRKNA